MQSQRIRMCATPSGGFSRPLVSRWGGMQRRPAYPARSPLRWRPNRLPSRCLLRLLSYNRLFQQFACLPLMTGPAALVCKASSATPYSELYHHVMAQAEKKARLKERERERKKRAAERKAKQAEELHAAAEAEVSQAAALAAAEAAR